VQKSSSHDSVTWVASFCFTVMYKKEHLNASAFHNGKRILIPHCNYKLATLGSGPDKKCSKCRNKKKNTHHKSSNLAHNGQKAQLTTTTFNSFSIKFQINKNLTTNQPLALKNSSTTQKYIPTTIYRWGIGYNQSVHKVTAVVLYFK